VISPYTGDSLYVVGLPDGPLVVDRDLNPRRRSILGFLLMRNKLGS
jgi:hypothetical protein